MGILMYLENLAHSGLKMGTNQDNGLPKWSADHWSADNSQRTSSRTAIDQRTESV